MRATWKTDAGPARPRRFLRGSAPLVDAVAARAAALLFCVLVLSGACDAPLDTRSALIIQTLVDTDRDLIAMRPALVAAKYEAMAQGPQPFLRGTAVLFYRDRSRYQDAQAAGIHGDGAEQVLLYGDPHLENIGVTLDDAGVLLDGIDYDASLAGPFGWDLRRASLALYVGLVLGGLDAEACRQAVRELTQSYSRSVALRQAGQPLVSLRDSPGAAGRIILELLADGSQRYAMREELSEYTQETDGRRTLIRDERMLEVPAPWKEEMPRLLAAYRDTRRAGRGDDAQFILLDAVQRLGTGIASFPNLRFWVLVRGEGDGKERLLELKEERDPPQPVAWLGRGPIGAPGTTPEQPSAFHNAARVVHASRCLLASTTSEPDLGYVAWGGVSFQVRAVQRGRRDLDVERLSGRLREGRYDAADAAELGRDLGALLAGGHTRCGDASAIARALSAQGDLAQLADRTAELAAGDHAQLLRDLSLFQRARELRGPLLGARPAAEPR